MTGEFIPPEEVAELTGMSLKALGYLRWHGGGPRFYKPTPRTIIADLTLELDPPRLAAPLGYSAKIITKHAAGAGTSMPNHPAIRRNCRVLN